jgi:flagellar biosynthesis/type III secretory pathway protein FliH
MNKNSDSKKLWLKSDEACFKPFAFSEKLSHENFVSISVAENEQADFIPYESIGKDENEIKKEDDILLEGQDRTALLEQEAYEKGFAQGEKDGLEIGKKKARKWIENIENLFIELGHLKKKIIKQSEKEIISIVFAVTEKIVHHEIKTADRALSETIYRAINLAVDKSKIVCRVNPEDYDLVEQLKPELFVKIKEMKSMIVTSDPSISRGGCRLETSCGDVDASVESQLEKIHLCLEESYNGDEDD